MKVRETVIRSRNDGVDFLYLCCAHNREKNVRMGAWNRTFVILFCLLSCPEPHARRMVVALPEIRLLQAAIAVARELNFSRAAESLHIGQSTLSKQIYELESQLGFKLFERNHQTVELTDAGRAFVEEAREALLHTERAVVAAKAVSFQA